MTTLTIPSKTPGAPALTIELHPEVYGSDKAALAGALIETAFDMAPNRTGCDRVDLTRRAVRPRCVPGLVGSQEFVRVFALAIERVKSKSAPDPVPLPCMFECDHVDLQPMTTPPSCAKCNAPLHVDTEAPVADEEQIADLKLCCCVSCSVHGQDGAP
jgi:hypothetical protein